jgi:hypothetical protein
MPTAKPSETRGQHGQAQKSIVGAMLRNLVGSDFAGMGQAFEEGKDLIPTRTVLRKMPGCEETCNPKKAVRKQGPVLTTNSCNMGMYCFCFSPLSQKRQGGN